MSRAGKICSDPECPNLQPCPKHTPEPWAGSTRRSRLPSGWSSRIVPRILRRDPICKVCDDALSREVDHVEPNDDHSDENLQGICVPCHRAKTLREAAEARNGDK